jgi:transposase-like protein
MEEKPMYLNQKRQEAVRLALDRCIPIDQVSRLLSISRTSVGRWVKAAKNGTLHRTGINSRILLMQAESDLSRTKQELSMMEARFNMIVDLLQAAIKNSILDCCITPEILSTLSVRLKELLDLKETVYSCFSEKKFDRSLRPNANSGSSILGMPEYQQPQKLKRNYPNNDE